jgi:hypothetical protein
MGSSRKKSLNLITHDEHELKKRLMRLRNKFSIPAFIDENGIEWAEVAIDPTNEDNWTHDAFLACYESGDDN